MYEQTKVPVRDTLLIATAAAALAAARRCGRRTPPVPAHAGAANGAVTLAGRPARIVSLSPTATEDLYAVDAGKQVVAVDSVLRPTRPGRRARACPPTRPTSRRSPRTGRTSSSSPTTRTTSSPSSASCDIPVLVEPPAANLAASTPQIDQIARATGHPPPAASSSQHASGRWRRSSARCRGRRQPITVYHELDQKYYSATSRTFIGQMYKLLGLHNIADKAGGLE